MTNKYNRKIILEDGSEYFGYSFGDGSDRVCEIVFNTSPVGYQEIISDPSYTYQAIVMTYPLIGNYGMCPDDYESEKPTAGGLIVREYNDFPSGARSRESLSEVMKRYGIPGISGIDTRQLTRSIRDLGSRKVLITGIETTTEKGLEILDSTEVPKNAVSKVSPDSIKFYKAENETFHIAAIDCGMKLNIIRSLLKRNCSVAVVPWNTPADKIEALKPDGILVSNGPGDPSDIPETVETIKKLKGKYPMLGICLGHQLIALSYGAKTYKLKFGHRGGNHPIKNLKTNKIEITSQNHSYAVDAKSTEGTGLEITHINLLDNTVEGLECKKDRVFTVQYHPESAPGPQDSGYLFESFIENMKAVKEGKNDNA